MQDKNQQPYFFNPGMTPEQLEEWLNQQMFFVARYNHLVKKKAVLVKEKADIEEKITEIDKAISAFSEAGLEGVMSFPCNSDFVFGRSSG